MATHYVNNTEMLESIKQWRSALAEATAAGKPRPEIPKYLGECILKIATNLSYKINFINYSYRNDMISDGIENCISCFASFDPAKSSNPFSYFTQVIYFAFLRRIAKEKKQSYIRSRLIQEMSVDSFDTQEHDDDTDFKNAYSAFIQSHQNFDDSFIKKRDKPKERRKTTSSLEEFFDVDDVTVEELIASLDDDSLVLPI